MPFYYYKYYYICAVALAERMDVSSALSRIIIDLHLDVFAVNAWRSYWLKRRRAHVHLCLFIFSRVPRTHKHTRALQCTFTVSSIGNWLVINNK